MESQECASYDIKYIREHYIAYYKTLEVVRDDGDTVQFLVRPRNSERYVNNSFGKSDTFSGNVRFYYLRQVIKCFPTRTRIDRVRLSASNAKPSRP
jgi:hypothetical protein